MTTGRGVAKYNPTHFPTKFESMNLIGFFCHISLDWQLCQYPDRPNHVHHGGSNAGQLVVM